MALHSVYDVEKLENRIKDRLDKLLAVMQVKNIPETDLLPLKFHSPQRRISDDDIRTAVDECLLALKEVKAQLGKAPRKTR